MSPDASDPLKYRNREQYQFVSVTKENMAFGFGRHACPGRFFAANEIKLILARLLLGYDMRLPEEGEVSADLGEGGYLPEGETVIMLKRVKEL